MKFTIALIAALPLAAAWSVSLAQAPAAGGDSNAGRQIATSGAPNGVAACASCHGAQGEGNAGANFPRIAGQPQRYLARQMTAFANGNRNNAVMTPIAKALSPEQIEAVSAYYAGLQAPATPAAAPPADLQKRGMALATVGDDKLGVQGCNNCHGPGGRGEPPNYPALAGQHKGYLAAALREWKSGARKTDPSLQMNMIAKRLSDSDIAAVSAFFAAQPAPPPLAQSTVVAPPASAGATGQPAGPPGGQASTPTQGVGVEQGAATSGGGQGPGGGGGASGAGPSGSPTGEAK